MSEYTVTIKELTKSGWLPTKQTFPSNYPKAFFLFQESVNDYIRTNSDRPVSITLYDQRVKKIIAIYQIR